MDTCPNCGAAVTQTRAIPTAAEPLAITEACAARCGWSSRRSVYVVPVDPASLVDYEGCQ